MSRFDLRFLNNKRLYNWSSHFLLRNMSDDVAELFVNLSEKQKSTGYGYSTWFILMWLNFLSNWKHFRWNSAKITSCRFHSSKSLTWFRPRLTRERGREHTSTLNLAFFSHSLSMQGHTHVEFDLIMDCSSHLKEHAALDRSSWSLKSVGNRLLQNAYD